ncbi:E3 ubiquitin-protein ligase WAV3 [Linum grandiflorum]
MVNLTSQWRKAKSSLAFTASCFHVPRTLKPQEEGTDDRRQQQHTSCPPSTISDAAVAAASSSRVSATPTPPSSGLLYLSESGERTCPICLTAVKTGLGQAIFTAECSHSFHFHCIASNVKHGKQICPVCRAKWKEVPSQSPKLDKSNGRPSDSLMNIVRRIPPPRLDTNRHGLSHHHIQEPAVFDDDEPLDCNQPSMIADRSSSSAYGDDSNGRFVEIRTYPEYPAVSRYASDNDFSVLVHLKAPPKAERRNNCKSLSEQPELLESSRAPVDLITVLDTSGSMTGTKLALLKRAMGFVIHQLGPSDRLSVVSFSSSAHRLFPLRCMTETGKQEALQAVNSLTSNGGTNIAEGLKKGLKVLLDRKWKNPVGSIILLSDGQDTHTIPSPGGSRLKPDYKALLPVSAHRYPGSGVQFQVHTFGFGTDHDAGAMHSIAEASGGTFSFIEAESVIQDAFAQCIGGLLSVVVQELQVKIECVNPSLRIRLINAGSYRTRLSVDARAGSIEVGDLYAEEERDILVTLEIPVDVSSGIEMSLLNVKCIFKDPITNEIRDNEGSGPLKIQRPEDVGVQAVGVEVDRQRNRLRAAEAMAEAKAAAEQGDLSLAVSILDSCRKALSETASVRAGDQLCTALCSELREMRERMRNRAVYESTGRAYVLSGLSSHSWQRATARGDSTDSGVLTQTYQTPSMADMVDRSQIFMLGNRACDRKLMREPSFPARKMEPRFQIC